MKSEIGKVGNEMKKFLKEYLPLIIFYIIMCMLVIEWCDHVEKTDHEISSQNVYYREG